VRECSQQGVLVIKRICDPRFVIASGHCQQYGESILKVSESIFEG
jgi:NADH:ubiquinone oxidoreductase subunit B-like Fe-S oxidoreductase